MGIVREHINFQRNVDPKISMGTGIAAELFHKTHDAYSFDNYKPAEWFKIIKWLLKRYTPEETEQVVRSKLMRWAADNSGRTYGTNTLQSFKEYNEYGSRYFDEGHIKREETAVDNFLRTERHLRKMQKESQEFKRDIEPKKAMSVGIDPIKEMMMDIIKIDVKRQYMTHLVNPGNIMNFKISSRSKIFRIDFYSNKFIENQKPIRKHQYAKELVELVDGNKYFSESYIDYKVRWNICFRIKPEYQHLFEPGYYDAIDMRRQL